MAHLSEKALAALYRLKERAEASANDSKGDFGLYYRAKLTLRLVRATLDALGGDTAALDAMADAFGPTKEGE